MFKNGGPLLDQFPNKNFYSVIVVTYNSRQTITECLRPLVSLPHLEIIVVDNHSQDFVSSIVKSEFPSVQFLQIRENIGFGRACNIGVAASSGSYLMFLNPDAVASSHALEALFTFLENYPKVGIVGARLIDPIGQPLQSMGDTPSIFGLMLDKPLTWMAKGLASQGVLRRTVGRLSLKFRLPNSPVRVPWVSAAALCCRRSTWDEVKGFDENFFLYYEDVDLCMRSSQAGWEVWHVPEAVVSHQSGASFGGNQDFQKGIYFKNQKYFFEKHCGSLSVFFLSILQNVYCRLKLYRQFASDRIGPSL